MKTGNVTPRATALELIKRYLHSPECSWSNGIAGALGEFMYDENEAVRFKETNESLSAITGRGAISIKLPAQITCFAYEQLTHCTRSWAQTVALALPRTRAGVEVNRVITDLGVDKDAVDAPGLAGRLFDLGLGSDQVQFCVRARDRRLVEKLALFRGLSLFDNGRDALALLQRSAPARVIISKLGRIEVYTPIPEQGEHAELGPHTHLLPGLLSKKESIIPDDYSATIHIYPPHPLHDKYGVEKPFDRLQYEAFQDVLKRAGLEDYLREKTAAVAKGSRREDTGGSSKWADVARQIVKMQSPYIAG